MIKETYLVQRLKVPQELLELQRWGVAPEPRLLFLPDKQVYKKGMQVEVVVSAALSEVDAEVVVHLSWDA